LAKIKLPDGCADGEIMDPMSFQANFKKLYVNNTLFCEDLVVLML